MLWRIIAPSMDMASLTVIQGEGRSEMTDAAELEMEASRHGKMLCRPLFDIEDIRMAVGAVEPLIMRLVRKGYCRYAAQLGIEVNFFIKRDRFIIA